MVLDQIAQKIESFEELVNKLSNRYTVTQKCPYVYEVLPADGRELVPEGRESALFVMGATHGNELAGLASVVEFLKSLCFSSVHLQVPVIVALGNYEAVRKNQRFLEKDLNRSFLNDDYESLEGKRARELEKPLSKTMWLLDFHQTLKKSEEAFFIFPYTKAGYEFARGIHPQTRIVTHWGDGFSVDGSCTDEFLNRNGGAGLSYELGQNGFDPYQIALGAQAALSALDYVTSKLRNETRYVEKSPQGQIFTWETVVPFPPEGRPILTDGFYNFQMIQKGEVIGDMDGKPIHAKASGRIIFPKYITKNEDLTKRPSELYRLMKAIKEVDLPH